MTAQLIIKNAPYANLLWESPAQEPVQLAKTPIAKDVKKTIQNAASANLAMVLIPRVLASPVRLKTALIVELTLHNALCVNQALEHNLAGLVLIKNVFNANIHWTRASIVLTAIMIITTISA